MADNIEVLGREASVASPTNKVLRNTYALLGMTMIPTVLGAMLGISINFSFLFAASPIVAFIGIMAVVFGMSWLVAKNANNAAGIWLLFGFTFIMGMLLGPILQVALGLSNGAQLIGLAAGGTAASFLTLSAVASNSKRDFSFLGKFITIGFVLIVLAILANFFFQIPALSLTISAGVVLLMSAYILYEINQIVRGGQTNYVMATLSIYISLHNMFSHLLHLLMALMGGND
ncbi:MAG: Bax inhibitor-1/YccA family protein [Methylophilaceae bacterium]|jgi:modulator of FtsH protease|nr:Bax inhibitor-1/YccA family protein [Methylophilaceae bacterium]|tara:strand:- start:781 stop:1473 length:693 start_codon:yes stop_codon:yes gene_type:complete